MFLIQVYDAGSSEALAMHTFESAEQAAETLGIEWRPGWNGSQVTHVGEIKRGNYFAYSDPESYDADDIARYNKYEPVYASGLYAKPGQRINWDD